MLEVSPLGEGEGLKLSGELDRFTVSRLNAALFDFASTDEVRLDLSELLFVDSAGLHAILVFARSRQGNGSVVLLNPSAAVMRVFASVDIHRHAVVEIQPAEATTAAA